MEERVKRIVAVVCGLDVRALLADRDLADFGVDSGRALEVIAECEDSFGVEIAEDAVAKLRTIADIAAYLRAHGAT